MGGELSRNFGKDFPRTRFSNNISFLSVAMKQAHEYTGMLLCLLLSLVLADGKRAASNYLDDNSLVSLIKFIELVLGMEEFLKHGEIKLSEMDGLK